MLVFSALALLFGGVAGAAPRHVAVINLAGDGTAGAAAGARLRAYLERQADLDPLPPGKLARALESALPATTSEDDRMAEAQALMRDARAAYMRAAFDEALDGLRLAQSKLAGLVPTSAVRLLLAELSIEMGGVELAKPDRDAALSAFRLARAFDPTRTELDPAGYDPDTVKLYADAGKPVPPTATLAVSTEFDAATIWIDGAEISGRSAAVVPGVHLVTASLADYRPSGRRVVVVDGQPNEITLPLDPLPADDKVRRLRRRLSDRTLVGRYLDGAREAGALTQAEAVVVIRTTLAGAVEAALWQRGGDALGEWRSVERDAGFARVLAPLLPDVTPPGGNGSGGRIVIPPPPPPPPKWWQRPEVQAGGAAAVLLGLVITSVALSSGSADQTVTPTCFGFDCE